MDSQLIMPTVHGKFDHLAVKHLVQLRGSQIPFSAYLQCPKINSIQELDICLHFANSYPVQFVCLL